MKILFIFLILGSSFGYASIKDELYLKAAKNQKVFSYSQSRKHILGNVDLKRDGRGHYVRAVYCQRKFRNSDFKNGQGLGPGRTPDHTVMNIEHTWPQSRFSRRFPKNIQKSDLHHLYPTDSKQNGQRGSHLFAEVSYETRSPICSGNKIGGTNESGGTFFEPAEVHKGNVARAIFYFSIRYQISIPEVSEKYLRHWHEEDPVDHDERQRHEAIARIQGNRNPFIDDPSLVRQVSDF